MVIVCVSFGSPTYAQAVSTPFLPLAVSPLISLPSELFASKAGQPLHSCFGNGTANSARLVTPPA